MTERMSRMAMMTYTHQRSGSFFNIDALAFFTSYIGFVESASEFFIQRCFWRGGGPSAASQPEAYLPSFPGLGLGLGPGWAWAWAWLAGWLGLGAPARRGGLPPKKKKKKKKRPRRASGAAGAPRCCGAACIGRRAAYTGRYSLYRQI